MNKTDLIIETLFLHQYLEEMIGLEPDVFQFVQDNFIDGVYLFDLMRKNDVIEYGKFLNKKFKKNEIVLLHQELTTLFNILEEDLAEQK
jgi:hypothetical protein